jgi:hypothetical protein
MPESPSSFIAAELHGSTKIGILVEHRRSETRGSLFPDKQRQTKTGRESNGSPLFSKSVIFAETFRFFFD